MTLRVILLGEIFLEKQVQKVSGEAQNGSFCLLPRHVDFLTVLVPGIFSFVSEEGDEQFMAVDEGVLVKRGFEIMVSARNAVTGKGLGTLKETVEEQFSVLNEREKKARSVLAKLETDFVRRFMEMNQ